MEDKIRSIAFNPSDSNITASFQKLCGIKIHRKPSKGHHNHENGVLTNGSARKINGKTDHLLSNGGVDCQVNGVKHDSLRTNGLRKDFPAQNGLHYRLKDISESNGTGYLSPQNGPSSNSVQNGLHENGHSQATKSAEETVSYTIENPLLYYVFSFGASLGNEIFYILFFSSTLWNFDSYVVRKVLIVWAVIMYLGQAAKDVIKWPRPNSPPVVRLEERYELEYGMPSTHAMVGVAIPFGMLIFMTGRYEFHYMYGVFFAIAWSILVSFSRLYLGMHSVLDIVAGVILAFLLIMMTVPWVDTLDKFLVSHPYSLPIMVAGCITLCFLYPSLDKWSTARGDTTLTLGVFSGIYAGIWITGQLHPLDVDYHFMPEPEIPPFVLGVADSSTVMQALCRQIVGVAIVVAYMAAIKSLVLHVCSWILGLDPKDPHTKRHLGVELPYKYISYFSSATMATYVMPLLFLRLGISRDSYYSEVYNYRV